MIGWLMYWLGLDDPSGPVYLFWSGIGSDLSEFAILGGIVAFWRKHACHEPRCWRFARYPHEQDGLTYQLCRKHHPTA